MIPLLLTLTAFAGTERFAVIAGSNDGGSSRATLRYASTDAAEVAEVLSQLGGLTVDRATVLLDSDPAQIADALQALKAEVADAHERGARTEVFFYYSGHSDEEGLLPRGELYDYKSLRDTLDDLEADVQLVILDSCASGAISRTKGGTVTPPFLVDSSHDVRGRAYLTSSSADEVAQESDRIGASYFTHYLLSGLRGGADRSGDGLVTLSEVYQFARDETLARTERSLAGPQHPSWDIQLAGTGDLVVTSLDATVATLFVPEGISGRLFVRDEEGDLVAELAKPADRGVMLGMAPGEYVALLVQDDVHLEAHFSLDAGATVTLTELDFVRIDGESNRTRGDAQPDEELLHEPVDFMLFPTTNTTRPPRTVNNLGIGLVAHHADRLDGVQASLGANLTTEEARGAQMAIGGNLAEQGITGAQLSVGANLLGGDLQGLQWTTGANIADGDVSGIQAAVGGNIANGAVDGIQGSVGVNVATGDVRGAQLAVGANVADHTAGLQAGGVNVVNEGKGLQIGLINIGRKVDGLQLGLVNVAEDADESIALIPINGAGYNHLVITGNESDYLDIGLSFGGKHLYTTLRYGVRPQGDIPPRQTALLGLGVHVPAGPLFVDTDVASGNWFEGATWQEAVLVRGRLGLGVELAPKIAIIAGPTIGAIPWNPGRLPYRATGPEGNTVRPSDWGWVGIFAGIRLL